MVIKGYNQLIWWKRMHTEQGKIYLIRKRKLDAQIGKYNAIIINIPKENTQTKLIQTGRKFLITFIEY